MSLAKRLSVFWGSVVTRKGAAAGGRFPPVDRLDLIEWGQLLAGRDVRGEAVRPTAREMGVAAVEYFTGAESGAAGELALKAFEWRYEPPRSGDPAVLECVERGLLPLYRLFAGDYEAHLRGYGEAEVAQAFADWRARLG